MALEVTYSNVKIHIVDTGLRLNFSIFSSFKAYIAVVAAETA